MKVSPANSQEKLIPLDFFSLGEDGYDKLGASLHSTAKHVPNLLDSQSFIVQGFVHHSYYYCYETLFIFPLLRSTQMNQN